MNGTLTQAVREITRSWRFLVAISLVVGFLLSGWTKVKTVAQIPEKVDSLKIVHDTQTAIMRRQVALERCLIILSAPPELRSILPRDSRRRCLTLAVQEPQ